MTTPSINEILNYADLQMAAEAFLVEGGTLKSGHTLEQALLRGNDRSSKFTKTQATDFLANWAVVAQQPNTETGFSGTLFRRRQDDPVTGAKVGDLVMSFRSTEFLDDAVRDNQATNTLEVKNMGWALGQIADMEVWYASLKAGGKIKDTDRFAVTGYSLGGHLATAFGLLRREEEQNLGTPNPISETLTFNGAGVGEVMAGASLSGVIALFDRLRKNADGQQITFAEDFARQRYLSLIAKYGDTSSSNEQFTSDNLRADAIAAGQELVQLKLLGGGESRLYKELSELEQALSRMTSIKDEQERLPTLKSGDPDVRPIVQVSVQNIESLGLDYQLAALRAAQFLSPSAGIIGGLKQAILGREFGSPALENFYDVYGATLEPGDYSAVANSQLHYGQAVPVWIENQPLTRGKYVSSILEAAWDAHLDTKTLPDGFAKNDFGDTHSLVLIVDSLMVQSLFVKLNKEVIQDTLHKLFDAATNQQAKWGVGKDLQGLADGNALESVVNVLAHMLGVTKDAEGKPLKELKGKTEGGTWAEIFSENSTNNGDYTDRNELHARLKFIAEQIEKLGLTDKLQVLAPSADMALMARQDFGAYLALRELSPFYLTAKLPADQSALDAQWQILHGDEYLAWRSDKEAVLYGDTGHVLEISDRWIADRTALLQAMLVQNRKNSTSTIVDRGQDNSIRFVDLDTQRQVVVDNTSNTPTEDMRRRVVFGSQEGRPLNGTDSTFLGDRLYGGGGNDTVKGLNGADHIEGNVGDDSLDGGQGNDTLDGGAGDDTLLGGEGDDKLQGGAGADVLQGGQDSDALYGGQGDDELEGGEGHDVLVGGQGTDKLLGGSGNDYLVDEGTEAEKATLMGEAGRDVLDARGVRGQATLQGGEGGDWLLGGQGVNRLSGDQGSDRLEGGTKKDVLLGGEGSDRLLGGAGDDELAGGTGADFMRGGEGNDTYLIENGSGADLIEDTEGTNLLLWGSINDWRASYDSARGAWVNPQGMLIRQHVDQGTGAITLSIQRAQEPGGPEGADLLYLRNWQPGHFGIALSGGPKQPQAPELTPQSTQSLALNQHVDFVRGLDAVDAGEGNDIVRGTDAANMFLGGQGNDILDGQAGADWLEGGEGNDIILSGSGQDSAWGGEGNDLMRAGYVFDMQRGLYANGEPVIYHQTGGGWWLTSGDSTSTPFTYSHSSGTQTIAHPEFAAFDISVTKQWSELASSYLFYANWNNAQVNLEPSLRLTMTLGDPLDVKQGEWSAHAPGELGKPKTYTLDLGDASKVLSPGSNTQGVQFWGGAGEDMLYGAHDNDRLEGGEDDDILVGHGGHDTLLGGQGKDSLSGGSGQDHLDGGSEDDMIVGGHGADVIFGGEASDEIHGGAGNDVIMSNHGGDISKDVSWELSALGITATPWLSGVIGGSTWSIGKDAQGNLITGSFAADYVRQTGGAWALAPESATDSDTVSGGAGDDYIWGGLGADVIDGGDDDDQINGLGGADFLLGGAGDDRAPANSAYWRQAA